MTKIEDMNVSKIVSVLFLEHQRGAIGENAQRNLFGLSFCAHGHITFFNDDTRIELTPGSVVLLPQNAKYSWICHKSGLYPQINFQADDYSDERILKFELGGYTLFGEKMHDLQNALMASSRARTMSIFYDILDNICAQSKPGNHILSKAIDYILENYSDASLSNKVLAAQAGISEVYFRKLFKENFDITPKQYVLDFRIKKACKMLLESQYNVSEISEKCGFSSVYHFCRAFKDITSHTPTEYAKSNKSYNKYM